MGSWTNAFANSEDAINTFREQVLTFVAFRSTRYSSLTGSMRCSIRLATGDSNARSRIFSDRRIGAKITIGFGFGFGFGCVLAIVAVISLISYFEFGRVQFDVTDYARTRSVSFRESDDRRPCSRGTTAVS